MLQGDALPPTGQRISLTARLFDIRLWM